MATLKQLIDEGLYELAAYRVLCGTLSAYLEIRRAREVLPDSGGIQPHPSWCDSTTSGTGDGQNAR